MAVTSALKHAPAHGAVLGINSRRLSGTVAPPAPVAQRSLRPGQTPISGAFPPGFKNTGSWPADRLGTGFV